MHIANISMVSAPNACLAPYPTWKKLYFQPPAGLDRPGSDKLIVYSNEVISY
jgi:hypothetical protein